MEVCGGFIVSRMSIHQVWEVIINMVEDAVINCGRGVTRVRGGYAIFGCDSMRVVEGVEVFRFLESDSADSSSLCDNSFDVLARLVK